MHYIATADTDVGTVKNTNQDSVLIKHASLDAGEVLMAIVCDGMGGLAKGELASATVIRAFKNWFEEELPRGLKNPDLYAVGERWVALLRSLNEQILAYGQKLGVSLGTTFSGILFVNDQYVIAHIGDTRIYQIGDYLDQLTEDQTFVAREIRRGNMTPEQAKTDRRRNVLLQCVGASKTVVPQVLFGTVKKGVYMICSDGFRHVITPKEIYESFRSENFINADAMHSNARYLIELVKSRQERDNITVALIKADPAKTAQRPEGLAPRKQKCKLWTSVTAAVLCVALAVSGVICNCLAMGADNSTYDDFICIAADASLEEKVSSYKQAIAIDPNDTRAFSKLLEAYEEAGCFGETQSREFLKLYSLYKDGFDPASAEVATLNDKIGMLHMNYDTGGTTGFSARVQKAEPFFSANSEKRISDFGYQICEFFRRHILDPEMAGNASKSDYETLFAGLQECLDNMESAAPSEKLWLCNSVFMLIYDRRVDLASVDYEQAAVLALLDEVYADAKALTVDNKLAEQLQQELLYHYEAYRQEIQKTYGVNAERG